GITAEYPLEDSIPSGSPGLGIVHDWRELREVVGWLMRAQGAGSQVYRAVFDVEQPRVGIQLVRPERKLGRREVHHRPEALVRLRSECPARSGLALLLILDAGNLPVEVPHHRLRHPLDGAALIQRPAPSI